MPGFDYSFAVEEKIFAWTTIAGISIFITVGVSSLDGATFPLKVGFTALIILLAIICPFLMSYNSSGSRDLWSIPSSRRNYSMECSKWIAILSIVLMAVTIPTSLMIDSGWLYLTGFMGCLMALLIGGLLNRYIEKRERYWVEVPLG